MINSSFSYHNGVLTAEALPISEIAENVETPFYCFSRKQIERNAHLLTTALSDTTTTLHYNTRTNSHKALLHTLAARGIGAEVMNAGELARAIEGDMLPDTIIMSGAGKTSDDLTAALIAGVKGLTACTAEEIQKISTIAQQLGRTAPIYWHVKMDALPTNDHCESDVLCLLANNPFLQLKGLSSACRHEGEWRCLTRLVHRCRNAGFAMGFLHLTGQPESWQDTRAPSFANQLLSLKKWIAPLGCSVSMAYGDAFVADAGVLTTRILHVDRDGERFSVMVDAPSPGGRGFEIVQGRQSSECLCRKGLVYGPLGPLADAWGLYDLPADLAPDDLLIVLRMGSVFRNGGLPHNGRILASEVMVQGAEYAIIRRRLTVKEQMTWETCPIWMEESRVA